MIWIGAAIFLSLLTVVGDYFVKQAGAKNTTNWNALIAGVVIYLGVALSWFFVFRQLKLATIGVVYGVSCLIFLVLLGVIVFKEQLNYYEIAGVVLAIISMFLLARFSNI